MPAYLDRDISGDGQDSLTGSNVIYAVIHVTALGSEARVLTPSVPDAVARFGWFSWGDNVPVIGGARDYWREVEWINFLDLLWTPTPSSVGGGPTGLTATLFRWHLSIGAEAHVYVFGS